MAWAPDYCTVTELADFLRIGDEVDNTVLATAISAASRAIDRACNRQFGKDAAPIARFYTAKWEGRSRRWSVSIDDLTNETSPIVDYDSTGRLEFSTEITDFRLLPVNAPSESKPYTALRINAGQTGLSADEYAVSVTGTFGWLAVPAGVKQATMLQASRFASRRDSPYGIAGSPDVGSELRLLARLDPDVEVSIAPYRRNWWVAS